MKLITKNNSPYFDDVEMLVESLGYKLVEYTIDRIKNVWRVNVVIFTANGTGIDDCTKVHKPLQQRLEVLLNSQEVAMQVSSPGVNRLLKKAYEFKAFIGQDISVWDQNYTDWVTGKLIEYNDDGIVLETDNGNKKINFEFCKKARLV